MTRAPMAATDRRRQAGHKHFRKAGSSEDESNKESNGSAKSLSHLFSDRRKPNGSGRRST